MIGMQFDGQGPMGRPRFADPEGLRGLLVRLHEAGPDAWRDDVEAAAVMQFAADRYAALARKYGLEPSDAAVAAFEAMRNESTRAAADPWAVVTVAVRITLIAECRANGLLTSAGRARRREYSMFHDAERFSDRDVSAYRAAGAPAGGAHDGGDRVAECWAVGAVVEMLAVLGWPAGMTGTAVDYVCARLADIGDRHLAFEVLRRDKALRANLDVPQDCWVGLLAIVLGRPRGAGVGRHGVLARLLAGETVAELLADDGLVLAIVNARPPCGPAGGDGGRGW